MVIIYRHLYQRLLVSVASVTLIVTSIISIFIFIGELEALRNDYRLVNAAWYTITSIPAITLEILPFICLISVLTVVGKMAEDSELIILRVSGISSFRLSARILMLIFVVVCAFLVLDNYAFSKLSIYKEEYKDTRKYPHRKAGSFDLWLREKNAIILLTSVKPESRLGRSYIFQFDDNNQIRTMETSETGTVGEKEFRFEQIQSTNVADTSQVQTQSNTVIERNTDYNIKFSKLEEIDPGLLSLSDLYEIASFQNKQYGEKNKYQATFLSKLLLPVNISALVFLSLIFVFGSVRTMSAGSRVFIGIVTGLVFYFINRLSVPVHLATGLPAIISILFPGVLAVILGFSLARLTKS